MPRPQDIQDLIDHRVAAEGEHKITPLSAAGSVPMAGDDGKIDNSWLKDSVVTTDPDSPGDGKIPVAVLPDTVVQLVNGKIPMGQLPDWIQGKVYQSNRDGSPAQGTGFILSTGVDLMTYFQSQMGSVRTVRNAVTVANQTSSSISQCYTRSLGLSLENNNTQLVLTAVLAPFNCNCDCGP